MRRLSFVLCPLVAVVVIDPARVIFQALVLRRLRAEFPAMFDPETAAESVRLAIAEAR